METERHRTADKFGDLWPFLKTQENRTLARMKETEEQMQKEKNRCLDRLDQPVCSLGHLIRKMEETRELPASWFLQDVGSLLKSAGHSMACPIDLLLVPFLVWQAQAVIDDSEGQVKDMNM
ncbi:UNVERIFIED_CONTAM: hypothetical protein K2H54_060724 [Gekko kuhli]